MIRYFRNLFGQLPASLRFKREVSVWRKLWDHWCEYGWVPVYCLFSWFHLMRSRHNGKFIIVFQVRGEPKIDGYYIVCAYWTKRGAVAGARRECEFDVLVDSTGGRAAWCRAMMGRYPVVPESDRERAIRILSREPENLLP